MLTPEVMEKDVITYMGHLWVQSDNGVALIGVNEEGLEELTEITSINLPTDDEKVLADEVCGELEMDEGSLNIYSPIDGQVLEVNTAILEAPSLIQEDCYGDGWLLRIDPANSDDLEEIMSGLDDKET